MSSRGAHVACLRCPACVMGSLCNLQDAREELHAARAAAGLPNAGAMGAAAEFLDVGTADVDVKEEEQVTRGPEMGLVDGTSLLRG